MRNGIRVLAVVTPVVVVGAALQALTVAGDPIPALDRAFVLRVMASFSVLVATLVVLSSVIGARFGGGGRRIGVGLVVWWTAIVALAAVLGVLSPVLSVPVAIVGAVGAPAVQADDGVAEALRVARATLWRGLLGVLVAAALALVGWVVALLLGFFVTGPVAAFFSWSCFGLVATGVLAHWARSYRAATSPGAHQRSSASESV